MSFDPDEPRRGGPRLPPVAPPPRRIGSAPPSDVQPNGHGTSNGYGHANGGAIHQVGHYGGPPPPSLPQVSAPQRLPLVTVPSRRGGAPPPAPSRDPLADSITRVNSQPTDTQRDDPYGLAMTAPSGRPNANAAIAAEPLDWEDDEESTHVFQSSAPPPPPSPRRSLPRIAPPPVPRSMVGQQQSQQTLQGMARLDQPPPLSTVRLETRSALDQPRPDIVAERTPSYHGPLAGGGSPFFPPSPPIPVLSPSQATKIPSSATPLPQSHRNQGGFEPSQQGEITGSNGVVSGAEEVVRDQPFVKLAHGNPHTATELAIRKPVLPAHLAAPSHSEPVATAKKWLFAAAAAALLSVVALVFFLMGRRPGGVEVDVRDAAGASVPKAEVYIDGRKVCDATPCTVRDLDVGRYSVRVLVPSDAALEPQSADIQAGLISRVTFKLAPALGTLVVGTTAPGLHVFVDGVDRGPVPAKLADLTPGKHDIKLAGDRYKSFEQAIEVKAGDTADLGAPKLSVVKGRAVVSVKTDGVQIVLIRNDDTAHPKALEGPFPRPIEVETSSGSWKLVAKKKGLPDFVAPIDFSDGVAEKEIVVDLAEKKE